MHANVLAIVHKILFKGGGGDRKLEWTRKNFDLVPLLENLLTMFWQIMHGRYEFFGLPHVIPNTVNFHFGTSRLRFCELALTHVYFYLPKKPQPPSGKTQSIARNSINWNGCLSIISYTTFARGIIVYQLNMFICPTKYRYSDISLIYRRVRTSPYFASASPSAIVMLASATNISGEVFVKPRDLSRFL